MQEVLMTDVLVAFHTLEGQTAKVAARIAETMRKAGATVEVRPVTADPSPGVFDAVVLGDSIHAGHHSKHLERYVRRHLEVLNAKPTALFQVSLTSANPDERHTTDARRMVDELVHRTGFAPRAVGMFAGAVAYTKYGPMKRRLMRWIVKREQGDTDISRDFEYTDWDAVDAFARAVLSSAEPAAARRD